MAPRVMRILVAAAILGLAGGATSFRTPSSTIALAKAEPKGQVLGFFVAATDLGIYYGDFEEDCPHGVEMTVEAAYLATKVRRQQHTLELPAI